MKKLTGFLLAFSMLVFSCTKQDQLQPEEVATTNSSATFERKCASHDVLEEQMAADPKLKKRMQELEDFTSRVAANPSAYRLEGTVMVIPVVVHVVYKTAAENISAARIQSQINILNKDFSNTNTDAGLTPSHFTGVQATSGMNIRFELVNTIRKATSKRSWSTNDAVKKSSLGGSDPVSPTNTLNIWVCNLGNGLLGYAQFPGGNAATDGVVVLYSAFGEGAGTIANYNKGRTATHEVGHWVNLRHIWGDATCGNDFVNDTPIHNTSNGGCPPASHRSTCAGTPLEMTMNYMDYTYDACMYMFTKQQKLRSDAVFAVGGPRASFR